MRRLPRTLLVALLALASSCRVPTRPEEARPSGPACAILLSESNLRFARDFEWTGGPAVYTNLLAGLKTALATKGVAADFISEEDLARRRLCNYNLLILADTLAIGPDAEDAIRYFVKAGGILVGLNEVGRFQGGWTKPWHYEGIFGVKTIDADEWGTAVSQADGMFRYADVTPEGREHRLTKGLGEQLDFGPASRAIWITRPTTAAVLAWFPSYLRNAPEPPEQFGVVTDAVIAVSLNAFGRGKAVWISPNVHQRDPANWAQAGATLDLLARSVELAGEVPLPLPLPPPQVILGISQVGYAPGEKKRAILRVPWEEQLPFNGGTFEIVDETGKALWSGKLTPQGPGTPWGDYYYIADFTDLEQEGSYRFAAHLSGPRGEVDAKSGTFRVARDLWSSVVIPTQYSFFHSYRCGEQCHLSDPLRGGYHDATGDYAVRMWSMPHVAYGMAENILASPSLPAGENVRPLEELRRAVDWLLAMQDPGGAVWNAVKPTNDWSQTDRRPADEKVQRVIERGDTLNYETTYVAGMAHAAIALQKLDPDRSARALAAAKKTWTYIAGKPWRDAGTGEAGNFIWDCVELFRATGDAGFLETARRTAPILLERQFLETGVAQAGLRGDFLEGGSLTSFGDKQYKKFHTLGVYLGLVELATALPPGDSLRTEVLRALDTYFTEHLLRGATLTPYGQMITSLEPGEDGKFRIYFFTHWGDWVNLHGLNVDHLALGLAALKFADLTGRQDLRDFARAQAQWVVGVNPLGYCMVDHVGWTNPPMLDDKIGTGRFAGGIPNGIVGALKDRPAWGRTWDSREYWIPHNAYLLALAPNLDKTAPVAGR
ncbi:MAG: glycoside hydrolase family 9 protein [Verrucomicrobiota bacterium]